MPNPEEPSCNLALTVLDSAGISGIPAAHYRRSPHFVRSIDIVSSYPVPNGYGDR